jgi:hypothetical protein
VSAAGGGGSAPPVPGLELRGAHIHHHLRGGHGRLRHRLLIFFAAAFAVIIGLAALGAVVSAPSSQPLCQPYRPCGAPPKMTQPLVNQTVWRSSRFGFSLEYPASDAAVSQQGPDSVTLQVDTGNGNTGTILVQGYPASSAGPPAALSNQIGTLTGVTQLALDTAPSDQLLGSGVGYRTGAGTIHLGYFSAPQGVGQPVALASEAATDGGVTVSVTVAGPTSDSGPSSYLWQEADTIINSVRWPGGG